MVPVPVPVRLTPTVSRGTKLATTGVSLFTTKVQGPVPTQAAAVHPAKAELESGVAVSVTVVPWTTDEEQVVPQSMPAGLLVMVPAPAPLALTESVTCEGGGGAKLAVTV